MDDDSLVELYTQDTLTPVAKSIIKDELTSRNISIDMDILIQGSVEPIPASPTVKESASILAKGVITFLGLAFFFWC